MARRRACRTSLRERSAPLRGHRSPLTGRDAAPRPSALRGTGQCACQSAANPRRRARPRACRRVAVLSGRARNHHGRACGWRRARYRVAGRGPGNDARQRQWEAMMMKGFGRAAAGRADLDIDPEHPLETLRPGHCNAAFARCSLLRIRGRGMPTPPCPAWPVSPERGACCSAQTRRGNGSDSPAVSVPGLPAGR